MSPPAAQASLACRHRRPAAGQRRFLRVIDSDHKDFSGTTTMNRQAIRDTVRLCNDR
jgi:hypothetical protein